MLLTTKDEVSYFESYDLFRADSTATKAILDMRRRNDGQFVDAFQKLLDEVDSDF